MTKGERSGSLERSENTASSFSRGKPALSKSRWEIEYRAITRERSSFVESLAKAKREFVVSSVSGLRSKVRWADIART